MSYRRHAEWRLNDLGFFYMCKPENGKVADTRMQWFVLRDLRGPNAKVPACKELEGLVEVFTPMKWKLVLEGRQRKKVEVPLISDLLFARSSRAILDEILPRIHKLQYRYIKGGKYMDPMVASDADMNRFIKAVSSSSDPKYYSPDEIDASMIGKKVRIVGGALDGYEAFLHKIRGTRARRIWVELPSILVVSVEVAPEFIQLI